MAFQTNSFAKVWEINPAEKYTDIRVSTSKKRQDTGQYEADFAGFVRLIGEAHNKAKTLQVGDRIRLGSISGTTFKKADGTYCESHQCYSYKMADEPFSYKIVEEPVATQGQAPAPTQYRQPQRATQYDPSIPAGTMDEQLPFN